LALFIVLTGGTAVALSGSNTVFTDDIANDTQPAGGGNPAGGLVAADLRPNSVGTSEVADASIASGDLTAAARGARAYGLVDSGGNLVRGKNVTSVNRVGNGIFCINLAASIDPTTAVLTVGPDHAGNATDIITDNVSVVEWDSAGNPPCRAPALTVRTFFYDGDSTDDDSGGGNTPGDRLVIANQSFAFVVP
jgi:hypothetical protein